jgi:hypothetical protein
VVERMLESLITGSDHANPVDGLEQSITRRSPPTANRMPCTCAGSASNAEQSRARVTAGVVVLAD